MVFAMLLAGGMTASAGTPDTTATPITSTPAPAKKPANKPGQVLSAPYPTAHPFPVIEPKKALTGTMLKDALLRGGLVLYLRHTESGVPTSQCTISNLTPRGEADAVKIGETIRDLKLPIGKIFSSDICRVQDTARLLGLGPFEVSEDLTNVRKREGHDLAAARMKLIATPPPSASHHLLVSHLHGGEREDQAIYLDFGEIIVFRPDGKGGSNAVARIRMEDWPMLARLANIPLRPDLR